MILQDLLKNPPKLHKDPAGNLVSWKINDEVLHFINNFINCHSNTLETGAGISTVLFAIKKNNHICIVPDREQVDRIKAYCHQQQISTEKITFYIDKSENILPSLKSPNLDLILIDGNHAFPSPAIDWYYTAERLKTNGIVIIDDTLLWSCKILKEFLNLEPEWVLIKDFAIASAFKKSQTLNREKNWLQQPYIVRKSKYKLSRFGYRLRKAWQYIIKGELSAFKEALKKV